MIPAPPFYHGKILIWIILIILAIYVMANFAKTGQFLKLSYFKNVELIDLLSFGNFYNNKKICTKGYYLQTPRLSILKVDPKDSEYIRSAWVKVPKGAEIITEVPQESRMVLATICGRFESKRAGEFGDPPVFNHQITVEKSEIHGDPFFAE